MTDLEFGIIVTVVGMGGTLAVVCLISLVVSILHRVLSSREEKQHSQPPSVRAKETISG